MADDGGRADDDGEGELVGLLSGEEALGDETTQAEVAALFSDISMLLHGKPGELCFWALQQVASSLITYQGEDLGDHRHMFAAFVNNLHSGILPLSDGVETLAQELDLSNRSKSAADKARIEFEKAATRALTPMLINLMTGLMSSCPPNAVLSAALSAHVSVAANICDEASIASLQKNYRDVADSLPETKAQIVADIRDDKDFRSRATVGDVGRA